jgi:hypothetical protein
MLSFRSEARRHSAKRRRFPEGEGRGQNRRTSGHDRKERTRRDRGQDKAHHAHKGGTREGAARAREAAPDVTDVGPGDRRAQLSRLAGLDSLEHENQGQQGFGAGAADPRQRPLRPGEGQGAHRRVPCGPATRQQADRTDPVPGRPARRRQDIARQIDCAGDRARLRAGVARRCARRGGDSRGAADLYRLNAGQDHPVDAQGEIVESVVPFGRGGQDGRRLPRRPVFGPAGSARLRTTPSTTIISRSTTISPR